MARNWNEVRKAVSDDGKLDEQHVENARKDMLSEIRAHRLAEIVINGEI